MKILNFFIYVFTSAKSFFIINTPFFSRNEINHSVRVAQIRGIHPSWHSFFWVVHLLRDVFERWPNHLDPMSQKQVSRGIVMPPDFTTFFIYLLLSFTPHVFICETRKRYSLYKILYKALLLGLGLVLDNYDYIPLPTCALPLEITGFSFWFTVNACFSFSPPPTPYLTPKLMRKEICQIRF